MGSEGPPAITVHVTGFKKFHGVAENPTETIVSNLKDFVKRRGLCGGVTLGSCTILEAAGDGGLPKLYEIMESAMSEPYSDSLSNERVIWLHLGANAGALRLAIERQAVNEATFRCPDELGWQPQQVPIVPEDGGISRTRKETMGGIGEATPDTSRWNVGSTVLSTCYSTTSSSPQGTQNSDHIKTQTSCSTDAIAKFLRKQGYDVALSDDADQFVCNYVYYHSLRFAEQRGHKSLFVHVPLFSRIDEDTQMQFVASLLEALPIMY